MLSFRCIGLYIIEHKKEREWRIQKVSMNAPQDIDF